MQDVAGYAAAACAVIGMVLIMFECDKAATGFFAMAVAFTIATVMLA